VDALVELPAAIRFEGLGESIRCKKPESGA